MVPPAGTAFIAATKSFVWVNWIPALFHTLATPGTVGIVGTLVKIWLEAIAVVSAAVFTVQP